MFTQNCSFTYILQSFVVPMAENLLHWHEKETSIFYSVAGVEVSAVNCILRHLGSSGITIMFILQDSSKLCVVISACDYFISIAAHCMRYLYTFGIMSLPH